MSLKTAIESLVTTFTNGVLLAMREAKLEEILAASGRSGSTRASSSGSASSSASASAPARAPAASKAKGGKGRRVRRSRQQIAGVMDALVRTLKGSKSGMRSEELQKALSVDKKSLVGPIAEALNAKLIRKTGERRATTYFSK